MSDRDRDQTDACRRERAYIALLASKLEQVVENRFGIGSEVPISVDNWRSDSRRILNIPEIEEIRAEFHCVALANVRDELEATYAAD